MKKLQGDKKSSRMFQSTSPQYLVLPLQRLSLPQQLVPLPEVSCVLHTPPEVALWTTPTVVKKVKPKATWFQFPF